MMDVRISDLSQDDLQEMAQNIRPMDRFEADIVSGGQSIENVLDGLLRKSRRARAAYVGSDLVAIYGVVSQTLLSSTGNPWLLATRKIEGVEVRREFIRRTEQEVRWLCEGYDHLWNIVSNDNTVAIRWLRWIGFQFDADVINVRGHPFRRFSIGE